MDANGIIKKKGDFVIDLELANTFEKIGADNTKDTFYTGDLSKEIADDLSGTKFDCGDGSQYPLIKLL